jgi:hypothetical protein
MKTNKLVSSIIAFFASVATLATGVLVSPAIASQTTDSHNDISVVPTISAGPQSADGFSISGAATDIYGQVFITKPEDLNITNNMTDVSAITVTVNGTDLPISGNTIDTSSFVSQVLAVPQYPVGLHHKNGWDINMVFTKTDGSSVPYQVSVFMIDSVPTVKLSSDTPIYSKATEGYFFNGTDSLPMVLTFGDSNTMTGIVVDETGTSYPLAHTDANHYSFNAKSGHSFTLKATYKDTEWSLPLDSKNYVDGGTWVKLVAEPVYSITPVFNQQTSTADNRIAMLEGTGIGVPTTNSVTGIRSVSYEVNGSVVPSNYIFTTKGTYDLKITTVSNANQTVSKTCRVIVVSSDSHDSSKLPDILNSHYEIKLSSPQYEAPNGYLWYKDWSKVDITSNDNLGNGLVKTVVVSVNGNRVATKSGSATPFTDNHDDIMSAVRGVPKSLDHKYTISLDYTDSNNGTYHWSKDVYVDSDKASSRVSTNSTVVLKDGIAYYANNPILNVVSSSPSGISRQYLESSAGAQYPVDNNKVEVSEAGTYKLVVISNTGVKSELPLTSSTLTGMPSGWNGKFGGIDNISITLSNDNVGYHQNNGTDWYKNPNDVKFKFEYNTITPLKMLEVFVNGYKVQTTGTEIDYQSVHNKIDSLKVTDFTVKVTAYNGVTNTSKETSFKIDNTAPSLTGITALGATDSLNKTNQGNQYVFFFKDGGTVQLQGIDNGVGVKSYSYSLYNKDGSVSTTGTTDNGIINIPAKFKGWVGSIKATDYLGNTSEDVSSKGIISEDLELSLSNTGIKIEAPNTPNRTLDSKLLYNYSPELKIHANALHSGISSVEAKKNHDTIGSWNNSVMSKDDGNLSTKFDVSIGNQDTGSYSSKVLDNTSFEANDQIQYVVDTVAPAVQVSWNENHSNNLYNTTRIATIRVIDANISVNNVQVQADGGNFSGFKYDGTNLVGTVSFSNDIQNTSLKISGADLAGNKMAGYSSEQFSIDKTAPVMTVSPSASPKNGKYYNKVLSFTVTVRDMNVDANSLSVSPGYSRTVWTAAGPNSYTTTVSSNGDGEKNLNLSITDQAGNKGNSYDNNYIQDTVAPQVVIQGISDKATYTKGDVSFSGSVQDTNLDGNTVNMSYAQNGSKPNSFKFSTTPQSGTSNTLTLDSKKKDDGEYTATITAEDLAGNVTNKTMTFMVDRFGGTTVFSNKLAAYLHKLDTDIILVTTSKVQIPVDNFNVQYTLNGVLHKLDKNMYTVTESHNDTTGDYVYTINISRKFANKDGVYDLSVFTTDIAGVTTGTAAIEYKFIVDTKAPTINMSMSSDSSHYLGDKYTYSATDTYGLQSMKFGDNQVSMTQGTPNQVGSDSYKVGNHQVFMVTATDMAGNQSTYSTDHVNVYASFFGRYRVVLIMLTVLLLLGISYAIYLIMRNRHKVSYRL